MKVLRPPTRTLRDLLPTATMDRLLAAGSARKYADGQIVQERGDTNAGLAIVVAGQVIAGNIGLDGSFVISALLRPGETFGEYTLFAGLPRSHTLWSQGPSEITFIKAKPFARLFDADPAIARGLLTLTLLRNHEMMEFMDAQRRLSLQVRLARLLLASVEPGTASASVECRQEDLAFMLGVSRVAAGKALKKIQAAGLVRLGYGRIEIPSVQRLKTMVCDADQLTLPTASAE